MNPQSVEGESWKDRYTLLKMRWTKAARLNPERAVIVMDKTSELLQLYAVEMRNGRSTQLTEKEGVFPLSERHFPLMENIFTHSMTPKVTKLDIW